MTREHASGRNEEFLGPVFCRGPAHQSLAIWHFQTPMRFQKFLPGTYLRTLSIGGAATISSQGYSLGREPLRSASPSLLRPWQAHTPVSVPRKRLLELSFACTNRHRSRPRLGVGESTDGVKPRQSSLLV